MNLAIRKGEKVKAQPGLNGWCPLCEEKLIPRCGEIKRWHWAHEKGNEGDDWYEPEAEWHINWKENFDKNNQEVIITDGELPNPKKHFADIKTNEGLVIELQNSNISKEKIQERENFYGKMVWIINGKTIGKNLILKNKKKYLSFRWKQPPKSWWASKKPIYVDFSDNIKQLKELLEKYENGEKKHLMDTYEYYDIFNKETGEYMVGKRISECVEDTENEIQRIKKKINLLDGKLFEIKKIYRNIPCGGYGFLINKELFLMRHS